MFVPPRGKDMQTPWMDEGNASGFVKRLFGTIGGPLQALYGTRQGHGAEARLLAGQTVNTKGGPASDPSLCPSDKCLFRYRRQGEPADRRSAGQRLQSSLGRAEDGCRFNELVVVAARAGVPRRAIVRDLQPRGTREIAGVVGRPALIRCEPALASVCPSRHCGARHKSGETNHERQQIQSRGSG